MLSETQRWFIPWVWVFLMFQCKSSDLCLTFLHLSPPHRNRKKNVPMSQLPDEAQKQKRAAWRAASRRYYARKIARQRANPLRSGPVAPVTNSQRSGFMDKSRRSLISELPDPQLLQNEAWSRYYERKAVFHPSDNMAFGHVMENLNPSGAPQGPNSDGALANSGGIMCSWCSNTKSIQGFVVLEAGRWFVSRFHYMRWSPRFNCSYLLKVKHKEWIIFWGFSLYPEKNKALGCCLMSNSAAVSHCFLSTFNGNK